MRNNISGRSRYDKRVDLPLGVVPVQKGSTMGKRAQEPLELNYDELVDYLHANHSIYMKVGSAMYYLTDANFQAWRAQDTSKLNEKNHYIDCSDLVASLDEFMAVPFICGNTIKDVFASAKFYASIKGQKE